MNNDIDLKYIWKQQKVEKTSCEELKLKLEQIEKRDKNERILLNIIAVITIIGITFIWLNFEFNLITTKIGLILGLLLILFYVFFFNKISLKFQESLQFSINNDYVKELIIYHSKNKKFKERIFRYYFIGLFIGISLYSYEYLIKLKLILAITFYFILCIWFLVNWFYFKPKLTRKKNEQTENILKEYERINIELKEKAGC